MIYKAYEDLVDEQSLFNKAEDPDVRKAFMEGKQTAGLGYVMGLLIVDFKTVTNRTDLATTVEDHLSQLKKYDLTEEILPPVFATAIERARSFSFKL